ncbi:hypothetical protein [Ruegeria sp.]|uniref:hypothetical protein n=1 Tax=Ruegeria sp. TaxID=1879320 RepID=UPI003C7A8101
MDGLFDSPYAGEEIDIAALAFTAADAHLDSRSKPMMDEDDPGSVLWLHGIGDTDAPSPGAAPSGTDWFFSSPDGIDHEGMDDSRRSIDVSTPETFAELMEHLENMHPDEMLALIYKMVEQERLDKNIAFALRLSRR